MLQALSFTVDSVCSVACFSLCSLLISLALPLLYLAARFGVECTMADLISAPDLVMQVLTSGSASLASSLLLADERHLDALMK